MLKKYFYRLNVLVTAIVLLFSSCSKFVVADPPVDNISRVEAFSNDISAIALMTSVYSSMMNNTLGLSAGISSIGSLTGMECDEFKNYYNSDAQYVSFYTNAINNQNTYVLAVWQEIYRQLRTCNIVVEGLDQSTGVNSTVKKQLMGEAKFMRAFLYFYGVNLFGKIPLAISTDYRINSVISRSEIATVNQQILQDLTDAQTLLPDEIVNGSGNTIATRLRPNKWAATALLARFYLYQKEWSKAESEAAKFAEQSAYTLESNLSRVFLNTSTEAIWQMQPVISRFNTTDGDSYVLLTEPGNYNNRLALTSQLVNQFEPGDARITNWIGTFSSNGVNYFYPNKYKIVYGNTDVTEYTMVLRLAEQYLILAEAKIQQGRIAEGVEDLNILRTRSRSAPTVAIPDPLPDLATNISLEDALNAVAKERQTELFTEWGHRWFDLKRTGTIDREMEVYIPNKDNATWSPFKALWPIPQVEIQFNKNLTQNDQY
jgi:starch-binding outer membrane protein, SusD/RagB family